MRQDQYRELLSAGRTLVETTDTERVLHRLLQVARLVTGARYAALGVLDDERELLRRFLTSGIDSETQRRIGDLPQGRGVLGELIRHPEPLRLRSVGDHPRSYGFPPGHPPMNSFLGVPIMIGGEPYGNLYLTEKDGGEFDEDDEEAVGVIADWASVAIQNARLHAGLLSQRDELGRAVETLEATNSIAHVLAGETDLDRVLELIAKRGRAVVDARVLLITLLTPDGVVVAAAAGEAATRVRQLAVPLEGSNTALALERGRPFRFNADEVGDAARRKLDALGFEASSGLLAPLLFRQRGIGALIAVDRTVGGAFTDKHERLLQAFAVSAATAVGAAQSVTHEQRRRAIRATEEERRRWARELHDDMLQELAALRLGLSMGARRDTVGDLRDSMLRAVAELDGQIASLRALISDLRPAALDELGLTSALQDLTERLRSRGLDVVLDIELADGQGGATERLESDVEDALYRLAQEALTNVVKHARAQRAEVTVRREDGVVTLEVVDDGRGFDPDDGADGFGLLGMRERSELAGGRLAVESRIGSGTRITATLPARARRQATVLPEQLA